ncbi:MAG TPA: DUF934 domain-containing protein [Rhizobacter sp.]|nr:DUF934 domain-containing protein [Rhizobacter sp.]
MQFINPQQDKWHTIAGEDGPMVTLTPKPYSLLTLLQWHSVRASWPADMPVGVALSNDDEVADLESDLPRLSLVSLAFPKWTDGRAYSQAHLLRSRYRFGGELRATGEALVDMLPLMKRTGFDAVVLRRDQDIEAAHRALAFFAGHYQGDVKEHRPLFARPAGEEYPDATDFNQAGSAI